MPHKPTPEAEALKEASKEAAQRLQGALRRLQHKLVEAEVISEELLPEDEPPKTNGYHGK